MEEVGVLIFGSAAAFARAGAKRTRASKRSFAGVPMLVVLALLALAVTASASESTKIIERCTHGEPFGGYTQSAYREALKHMPTEVSEYSDCANLIRKAELAAAAKHGVSTAAAPEAAPNTPLPLTQSEQHAVRTAHSSGSRPVRLGSEQIRPGVVHANVASAVNTLPGSLFVVVMLILGGALALIGGEVLKRVRTRRHR